MEFEQFQAEFVKENKSLKTILGFVLLALIVSFIFSFLERRYFLYKGGAIFEERPLAEEICRQGFLTLAEGEPNSHIVTSGLIELVRKDPFTMNVDKLLVVKSVEIDTCKVILKSEGKIVAFKILMEGSDKNPFYYKVSQLDEILLENEVL